MYAMQTVAVYSQMAEKPVPKFSLAISEKHEGMRPTARRLIVTETNISKEVIKERACLESRGAFNISIVYEGMPLEENDADARHKRQAHARRVPCTSQLAVNEAKPGESLEYSLHLTGAFDMSKPGSYDITITKETFPDDLTKSQTVRSNTITVVVSEAKADSVK